MHTLQGVVEGIEQNASTVLICVAWSTSLSCPGECSQRQQLFPL